ncbi:DNA helicase [Stenotrophomonas phage c9-N]|uniref:DNA helicase n=1 Tax=Stenotrophomonas phage vB_SmeS_BUCT700 TaxID=2924895 RepID=A0AAE9K680_9CAUD|nr:DNA helicase [Stenotrophomonas phage vB_SmeS_BUCT700]UNY50294.1 DNA helicase [Stenotrophomonas phage vB_SmeS_BUCT703]WKC56405.1 DNA helicase [Stenotrophomonas phage c9-N]
MDPSVNTLLRLGMTKRAHQKLFDIIPKEVLEGNVLALWEAQAKFYSKFPESSGITDIGAWKTWLVDGPLSDRNEDDKELLCLLVDKLKHPVDEAMIPALVNGYLQQALSLKAMEAIEQWQRPDNEDDLDVLLTAATDGFKDLMERTTKSPIEDTPIDELYAEEETQRGFRWRLRELQMHMRPLRPSDSIVWAARPDRGKTTTVASEVSQMIPQLDDVYPDEEKCFIWFNNEGDSKGIRRRLYQAALGVPQSQMLAWHKDGTLLQRLHDAFGGEHLFNRIKIMSIHGYSSSAVLRLIKEHRPGLIVFDMVDNIRFNGLSTNGGTRTDQMLEEMYRWVRDYANIEQYAAISTSQISGDGEGMQYPLMSMLKDSKTGKQGACEAIVMWGEKSGNDRARYLGIPKNKLTIEGQPMNPRAEVYFAPEIARVMSLDEVAEE